jgi:hypothetical protein
VGRGRRRAAADRRALSPARRGAATPAEALIALHLLLIVGEVTIGHATAHARLAAREMTSGRYRWFFRSGMARQAPECSRF